MKLTLRTMKAAPDDLIVPLAEDRAYGLLPSVLAPEAGMRSR